MAARNDITGDAIVTKKTDDSYRDGWERIFGKKKTTEETKEVENEQQVRDTEEGN